MPSSDHELSSAQRRRMNAVQRTACELVLERGYDGFTMTELAEAAGVSRRTLFNYFSDKASAVLGCVAPQDSPAVAAFRAGGPTGRLGADITATVEAALTEDFGNGTDVGAHHKIVERAIASDPKLSGMALQRFEEMAQGLAQVVCERQEWPVNDLRGRTFAATFMALIKVTLDELAQRESDVEFIAIFREVLAANSFIHNSLD